MKKRSGAYRESMDATTSVGRVLRGLQDMWNHVITIED
jgi:hypothetical protein